MSIYTGYVYIWYDTRAKFYYIGGHFGKVEDSYICSNKMMLRAYKKRPETFRFRVLEYSFSDKAELRAKEQRWLDMIKDTELYWTPNIYSKTTKYYNMKKNSAGGNGQANKGVKNSKKGDHLRGKPLSPEVREKMSLAKKGKPKTPEHIAAMKAAKTAKKLVAVVLVT